MQFIARFRSGLFDTRAEDFSVKALAAFQFQAENCPVYRDFLHYLDIRPKEISQISEIPFLPIELFKTHQVLSVPDKPSLYFESSGTTGQQTSRHYIADIELYHESILQGFRRVYGNPAEYCLVALLPSYLERKNASLVYMCNTLMQAGTLPASGFYLNEWDELINLLRQNEQQHTKTILIGVSFALLDLADKIQLPLKNTIIIETGGMKGRKAEITREALHTHLKNAFHTSAIHSEYGMTELLSQAYATENGRFFCPPWMQVMIRDAEDPFSRMNTGATGCINIIDLANIHSCCFIATQDLGRLNVTGSFEVLGRFDNSDVRGCNLMVQQH